MFERFTEPARQAVVLAQEEARALRHGHIGTEHLLLGLVREEQSSAARALGALGLEIDRIREHVLRIIDPGTEPIRGRIPFTPRATRVIHGSWSEAQILGKQYVAPGHILLALVREGGGVAARLLAQQGADGHGARGGAAAAPGRGAG